MKAVIYWRYSKEEQSEYSDAAQIRACNALARARGWVVTNVYGDPGKSAKTIEGRPSFKRMLQDAERKLFDVVIVHKLDRFSRNLVDTFSALGKLADNDVSIISVTESQFDFTTPQGKLFLGMVALVSQWYLDNLSQETAKGKRERAMQGGWNGALPFGYTTPKKIRSRIDSGDPDAESLEKYLEGLSFERETDAVFDPHDIKGYLLAVELCENGYTDWEVAMELNKRGYRVKSHWGVRTFGKDTIRGIMNNRFYTGYAQYKGEWFPGKHPAAITLERWKRVQAIRSERRSKRLGTKRTDRVYPLRKLVRCRKCNGMLMRGSLSSGRRYYRCPAREYGIECSERMINAEKLEKEVRDWLSGIVLPEDWRKRILEIIRMREGDPDPDREERTRLEMALRRARDLYLWGDLDERSYKAEKAEIERSLNALRPPSFALEDIERAVEMLTNFAQLWDGASDKDRMLMAQALLNAVWIEDRKVVSIEPKPAIKELIEAMRC